MQYASKFPIIALLYKSEQVHMCNLTSSYSMSRVKVVYSHLHVVCTWATRVVSAYNLHTVVAATWKLKVELNWNCKSLQYGYNIYSCITRLRNGSGHRWWAAISKITWKFMVTANKEITYKWSGNIIITSNWIVSYYESPQKGELYIPVPEEGLRCCQQIGAFQTPLWGFWSSWTPSVVMGVVLTIPEPTSACMQYFLNSWWVFIILALIPNLRYTISKW